MNTQEFIDEINRRKPSHLPQAGREFLKWGELILGSGPYYLDHVRQAIGLLGMEYEFLGQLERRTGGAAIANDAKPKVAISQIIVIHNFDAKQCHRIRKGLIQSQIINFEGPVFINFSPFLHRTIDSLPADAFENADYHMERSVFELNDEGKTRVLGPAVHPVLFIKNVKETLVQLAFLLGGRRLPGLSRDTQLPHPLYQEFLNVPTSSASAIMDFMNRYKVFLFPMCWDQDQLLDYVEGTSKSIQLDLLMTEEQLIEFWQVNQRSMKNLLAAAARGEAGQVVLPPLFPLCEEAAVEWRQISGYFSTTLVESQVPEQVRLALLAMKDDNSSEDLVRVRRFYGWLSYMWVELADDIFAMRAALICQRCGKVISRGKHGRTKMFCSRLENLACYKARKAEYVASSRRK